MKDRGTYVLLSLFFASLVGLWVADFAKVPTRSELDRRTDRVLASLASTRPDDLRKVEILGGPEPLVFERREGNRWQMTAPMDVAADPSKVETLAYNLKELSRRPESATLSADPSQYGLAPPERTVKLWGPATDAPLALLEVGRVSLDRRYVRAGGSEGIEVVDARGLDLLRLAPIRWRDHELFRVPSFEVDALTLAAGGRLLKLRRGRGAWHVVEPVRLPASENRVDGLIADLGALRVLDDSRFAADDVKDADLDRYGLKPPALTIEVDPARVDRRRGPQVLHVGKPVEGKEGQVYARRGDQDDVVIIEDRGLKGLKPEANAFRSPKVADLSPARVVRIGVEDDAGRTIEAARTGNDWAIVAPSPAKADRPAILEFLKALDQLQTEIYLDPNQVSEPGLDKPSLTLKVWQARDPRDLGGAKPADPKGDLAVNLRIGRRDAATKAIYARVEGDPTILALPDSANAFLPRNPLAFRDRQVLSVDVDRVEQVRLVGPSRKITLNAPVLKVGRQNMGLAPAGWWMVEPVQAPADGPAIAQLLRLLANFRAESLVTEKPDRLEIYGLDQPPLTVTWSAFPEVSMVKKPTKAEERAGALSLEQLSLRIGGPLPGRPNVRYAKLDGYPLIFAVGPDVLATLDAEWHDHRILSFDPAHVRQVRLDWPDRRLVLGPVEPPDAPGWASLPGEEALEFDPAPFGSFLQAASKLTTPRFAQYLGDIPATIGLDPARLALRLEFDDDSPSKVLRIGFLAPNNQVFATTEPSSSGAVFLLPSGPFAPLMPAPRRKGDLPDDVFAR